MSTNDTAQAMALDIESIRQHIVPLSEPEFAIVHELLSDVKKYGNSMSDTAIEDMAKRYADRARHLAEAEVRREIR